MTPSLAAGVASCNIRVNAISPGFVNTEPQVSFMSDPDSRAQIESLHLLPVPDPEQVAPLAMFLLSDEAPHPTPPRSTGSGRCGIHPMSGVGTGHPPVTLPVAIAGDPRSRYLIG